MSEIVDYRPAELYDAGGNMDVNWYFVFYTRNEKTGLMERHKPTFDINRIKGKKERYAFAEKMIKVLNRRLKLGNVPAAPIRTVQQPLLWKGISAVHDKYVKKYSYETKKSYGTHLKRLEDFFKEKELQELPTKGFTADHAQDFQIFLSEERELSNTTVNNNVGVIRSYFEILRKKRQVPANPFLDVEALPERRSFKYIPYSEDEKIAIAEKLKRESPSLYLFSQLIYNCFARPKEITGLTRADFDFSADGKYLILKYGTIKNHRTSYRQILPPLYKLLLELGIDRYPMKTLIFEDIIGPNDKDYMRRKRITGLWQEMIQQDLGIKNNLYALKHTGNCDYILRNPNYDILWLQQQNGHASIEQTQQYIRDLPIRRLQENNVNVRLFGA